MEDRTSRTTLRTSFATSHRSYSADRSRRVHGDWRENAHKYEYNRFRQPAPNDNCEHSDFKKMKKEIFELLSNKKSSWTLRMIKKAYQTKTGKDPEQVAEQFAYKSFEEMLKSKQFSECIDIDKEGFERDDGEYETAYTYKCSQESARASKWMGEDRAPREREETTMDDVSRAMNEVGAEQFLDNKILIIKLLAKEGAETREISWQNVMKAYQAETRVNLNKDEFKKLFGTKNPLNAMKSLFAKELTVHESVKQQGQFYMKLNEPAMQLVQKLREAKKTLKKPYTRDFKERNHDSNRLYEGRAFKKRERFPSSSSHHNGFESDTPLEKATVRRERDMKPNLRFNQPSRFDDMSPSPEPTIEIPPLRRVEVPEVKKKAPPSESKHLSINGLEGIENNRYKAKDSIRVVKGGKVFMKEESEMPKMPSKPTVSQRGDGYYTDDDEVDTIKKPSGGAFSRKPEQVFKFESKEDLSISKKPLEKSLIKLDDDSDDPGNEIQKSPEKPYISHGEKWLQIQAQKEKYEKQRELSKIRRKQQAMEERRKELEQELENPKKNSLIQDAKTIPERVTLKPMSDKLIDLDDTPAEAPSVLTENPPTMRLNDMSKEFSPKNEDEFENIVHAFFDENEEEEYDPTQEYDPAQEESGKGSFTSLESQYSNDFQSSTDGIQRSSNTLPSNWSDDETFLALKIYGIRLNRMEYDERREVLDKMSKLIEESERKTRAAKKSTSLFD